MSDVTQLLDRLKCGESQSADELLPLVYGELRKLAAAKMANEISGQTLQPTALVHEAWVRLVGDQPAMPFANRAHFFAAAAEAMRRILIECARRRSAEKRGGGNWERVDLGAVELAADADNETLLLVNDSLEKLAQQHERIAQLVKLRFFGGLTLEEAGQMLGVTERTAKRHWAFARAWLYSELQNPR